MTSLLGYALLFVLVGVGFIFVHLLAGYFIRPSKMDAEKATIYECGEPTIGSAWVQFDLRFYVIALLFVIFDVEVAFFFPWAVVFGQANTVANVELPVEKRAEALARLEGLKQEEAQQRLATDSEGTTAREARQFGVIALFDILVFFGVLLVGFAYLWKRGDIEWVRSTAAERTASAAEGFPEPQRELVGSGR
jgi:NADH-quinone oxidoreductase subunit A